ncbi:carboxypeptidase-like regulatory domain-containing protein [Bythopirellula polymerisocia]|uniref:Carboxypeptidase regulatory-like domain-containing protein n=1 Tax=Bythopirellula polymerisocia TaxID=2528003 RepID=A0A5C6CNR9_9BACT|nr:carboxypeptidase-like regulatory domain-containing protein [Bythopirellula polymerisocia]TWU26028.1 hypothetical protein Pla144_32450 [Bythopirellula polymerisocia]
MANSNRRELPLSDFIRTLRLAIPRYVLWAISICLVGCGGDGATVSGRIAFDGEPIPEGSITFIYAQDSTLESQVQANIVDGEFVIESLMPGNYNVAVRAMRKTGQVPPEPGSTEIVDRFEQYIPVNYNSRTELTAEIAGDVDNLNFELQSPPIRRGRRR